MQLDIDALSGLMHRFIWKCFSLEKIMLLVSETNAISLNETIRAYISIWKKFTSLERIFNDLIFESQPKVSRNRNFF